MPALLQRFEPQLGSSESVTNQSRLQPALPMIDFTKKEITMFHVLTLEPRTKKAQAIGVLSAQIKQNLHVDLPCDLLTHNSPHTLGGIAYAPRCNGPPRSR